MTVARTLSAWTLLAALAVGGVVVPSVHDAHHGLERSEALAALAAHAASGDHHHHAAGADDHGPEAQPVCPTAAHLALDCAVCLGVTALATQPETGVESVADRFGFAVLGHGPPASAVSPSAPPRGPPPV